MTTLRAAARAARDRLLTAGVAEDEIEAEIEAEVLLRHAMDPDGRLSKAHLYARYGDTIEPIVSQRFEGLLARRLGREPAAYITGHREFYGLDFHVTPDVLIPRPETELLIETAVELAQVDAPRPRLRIADVGTGSGAVAVALAKSLPRAEVYATDVSRPALAIAAENARRHGVERRIAFRAGYLLTPLHAYVDLIVANLPYVRTEDWRHTEPEVRLYEPALALLGGGDDGLALIRSLLHQASRYLRPGGAICLEFGDGQKNGLFDLAQRLIPGAKIEVALDFADIPRVLTVRT